MHLGVRTRSRFTLWNTTLKIHSRVLRGVTLSWAGPGTGWWRQLWLAAELVFRGCCCSTHLEPSVIFSYSVCKIDLLPLAHKLAELGVLLHAYVISHKIPVNAVPSSLFLVQQQIWCLNTKHKHWLISPTKFPKLMLSKSQLFHTEFLGKW